MKAFVTVLLLLSSSLLHIRAATGADKDSRLANSPSQQWNQAAAAAYLDARESWWLKWPVSQRDHGTACVSCHTALPYALSRRSLRGALHEKDRSAVEQQMLDNIVRRVSLWSEVSPFYNEAQAGPNKTVESRGTEAVLNAIVLANYDAESGKLSDVTKKAFEHVWSLQLTSGPNAGSWNWLNFHNAPWEANDSPYLGASLVAVAVGIAPESYKLDPKIQSNIASLRQYLTGQYQLQPLLNQAMLLWASGNLPGLLTSDQRESLQGKICQLQRQDGGWSLASLGAWQRHDGTALETGSDGYATGLVLLALQQAGFPRTDTTVARGIGWLERNQDSKQGMWPSSSLNKKRDPSSDIGHFMNDAATAYAVMALNNAL